MPAGGMRANMIMNQLKMLLRRFVFPVTLLSLMYAAGCVGLARNSNLLEGWKMCHSQDPRDLDKAIRDDYQDYIKGMPARQRKYIGIINLFEDGKGQRAVKIEVDWDGTWLEHVLFYNSQNQRVKTIRYKYGHYAS